MINKNSMEWRQLTDFIEPQMKRDLSILESMNSTDLQTAAARGRRELCKKILALAEPKPQAPSRSDE